MTKRERLQARLTEQRQWVADHGRTLQGYLHVYGSNRDPEHYGDGAEAIYAADQAELARLRRAVEG